MCSYFIESSSSYKAAYLITIDSRTNKIMDFFFYLSVFAFTFSLTFFFSCFWRIDDGIVQQ